MEDLIMVGGGGCMREILWQIWESEYRSQWNVLGYIDNKKTEGNEDCYVGGKCCPYLGDDEFLLKRQTSTSVAVCVGSPKLRRKIVERLLGNDNILFPTLLLGNAVICSDSQISRGCIISRDSCISTNANLGEFVFVNIGATICHDGRLGDFVTISPHATIAGAVNIGSMSEIGLGTNIIQEISIGQNVITGAGSVVIHDIDANCTVAGVPARILR